MNDEIDLTLHLQTLARRQPSAPALLAPGGKPMTFGSLVVRTERIAARLRQWGFERGDVVAWVNGDRAQTAAALAMLPASATISPLSPSSTISTLSAALRRIGPKAIVVPSKGDSVAARAASLLDIAVMTAEGDDAGEAGAFDLVLAAPRGSLDRRSRHSPAWACIGTTSGATGSPKIVSHGHRQVLQTAHSVGERLGLGPGDISGHVMPLHLAGGIRNALFQSLLCGGAVNCLPEAGVDALIRAIAAGEVTYASAAFTMLREMLARLEEGARYDRGRLRFMRVASGRMEPGEMDRLERALGVPVVTGLASSESGTAAQQAPDAPRKRGSVGRPVASEVRLVGAEGRDVGAGEVGEIHVRGPQLFDGYIDDDELNARSFVDGWFRMGDLARFDGDGELHLVGRVKEVINRGGDKIAPLEIDEALKRLPEVLDAAAFGVPHARLGEEVVAAVVMRDGAARDPEAMLTALRASLGASRAPRRLWFVERLPRTDAGKLARSQLPTHVGFVPDEGPAQPADDDRRSPFERALAALWCDALGVPRVDADARFADLGGDEAIASALVARVDAAFGVALAPHALRDEASTVAKMVRAIEERRAGRV